MEKEFEENSFLQKQYIFKMHAVYFILKWDTSSMLASNIMLTEPVENIRLMTVNVGEENLLFTVKQSPSQTPDYTTLNKENQLITAACKFAVLKERHGTLCIMELRSFHHIQN